MRYEEPTVQEVVLTGRSPIKRHVESEIVFSSDMDEALTFFVSFPKSKREILKGRAAATEPPKRP
jgi:hypothetical protein